MNSALIDEIRNILKSTISPCYENTARTEVYCRCPNCGDSKKDKRKAHLYIKMSPPFSFYCQKCGYSGILNQQVLNRLQVFNNDLLLHINETNKEAGVQSDKINFVKKENVFEYHDDEADNSALASLDYFNKRFGTQFTLNDVNTKFKCVCNPDKFINERKITYLNKRFDLTKAIGFVSSDNKYMICRDSSGKQELRYCNVSIFTDTNKSKTYNIKTPINLLSDKITLVITEGIFDAIGIYLKLFQNSEDVIVAAACGKSYSQVIEHFINLGFLNLDIKIFSDGDVNLQFFRDMKSKLYYLKNSNIEIYYNKLGKDYGVEASFIDVQKTII